MRKTSGEFRLLRPEQLTISLAFPQREGTSSLLPLKESIRDFAGLLRPIVVRCASEGLYQVIDGRRQLKAVWELLSEGVVDYLEWIPCYVISSAGPVMDLQLFPLLNQPAPLGAGDRERVNAAIEEALATSAL